MQRVSGHAALRCRDKAHSHANDVAARTTAGWRSTGYGCRHGCSGCGHMRWGARRVSGSFWSGTVKGGLPALQPAESSQPVRNKPAPPPLRGRPAAAAQPLLGQGRHRVARHRLQQHACPGQKAQAPGHSNRHEGPLSQRCRIAAGAGLQAAVKPACCVGHCMGIVIQVHGLQDKRHLAGPLRRGGQARR